MKILSSSQFRVVAVFAVVLALLAVGLFASGALGVPGGERSNDQVIAGPLLAASRDRLSVCVEPVAGAQSTVDESRSAVETALIRASQRPEWATSGLDMTTALVQPGCPQEPYLLLPGASYAGKPVGDPSIQEVIQASEHRLFVFVLPDAEIQRIFGPGESVRLEPQEFLCQDHTCSEVTTGLYVAVSELRDPEFLEEWLARALGLAPPEDNVPEVPGQR